MNFKRPVALLVGIAILATAVSCGSLNRTIFNTQKISVDAGLGALRGWKAWHHHATNGLTDAVLLAKLEKQNAAVYEASRKMGATEQTISELRLEVKAITATNGNPATVQAALDLASQTLSDNQSNLVGLYKLYTGGSTFAPLPQ